MEFFDTSDGHCVRMCKHRYYTCMSRHGNLLYGVSKNNTSCCVRTGWNCNCNKQSDDLLLTSVQKAELCVLEEERARGFFPRLVPVPVTELCRVNKSVSTMISHQIYCTCYPPFALQRMYSISMTELPLIAQNIECSHRLVRLFRYDLTRIVLLRAHGVNSHAQKNTQPQAGVGLTL